MNAAAPLLRATAQAAVLLWVVAVLSLPASSFASPTSPKAKHSYTLDILGFNEGSPYRLIGAEAEAVLGEPGARLFRFESENWMMEDQKGTYVEVDKAVARFATRRAGELIAVYHFDFDGDQVAEMLLVPEPTLVTSKHRFAPTMLKVSAQGVTPIWSARKLPGQNFRVVDIRDLNADGRPEVLLAGESGKSGAYQFHQLTAHGRRGFASLSASHVDSLHYVNLDGDDRLEIVVRERVGRRGPAYQWTYVDHLYQWDGKQFSPADKAFQRYHDEQTLPQLLGDIIDNFRATKPILDEKVAAIRSVRKMVLGWSKPPPAFHKSKVAALRLLKRQEFDKALEELLKLNTSYSYDASVLVGLASAHAHKGQAWDEVLQHAVRALTVDPCSRQAWWWAGLAFAQLSERTAAVASFTSAVGLCGERDAGRAFLRARRGEPGMDAELQAVIDEALSFK